MWIMELSAPPTLMKTFEEKKMLGKTIFYYEGANWGMFEAGWNISC